MTSRPFRAPTGPDPERDVTAELSFHLEMRVKELIARGETPERARELALARFGDYRQSRQECVEIDRRRTRGFFMTQFFTELKQDIAYTLRTLRRAPGFTFVATLTLALGIGANSAIFSVVNAVLLESLPFAHADRISRVRSSYPDGALYAVSAPDFMSLRQDTRVFEAVEAYGSQPVTWAGTSDARELQGVSVSDGLMRMLGSRLAAGRALTRADNTPGATGVAVLDHGFWQREFGGDAGALGRSMILDGQPVTIVGILAKGSQLPIEADVLLPMEYDNTFDASTATGRRSEFLAVLGLARPDVSAGEIDADLRRIGATLQQTYTNTNDGITFAATPIRDLILGDVRAPLLMLLGAVGFVLLVACANVANLLLARASARQQEMAVRASIGAGRGRLVRQLVTESVMLSLVGGAIGLGLAYAGTRALVAAQPADIPRLDEVGVHANVVLFTFGLALVTGLVFSLVPAFLSTGRVLTQALLGAGRSGGATRRSHQVRAALVIAEMALAVVLLTGAGLLMRSFSALTAVPNGFATEHAMTFRLSLVGPAYPDAAAVGLRAEDIQARVRALPGVQSVGLSTIVPLGRGAMVDFAVDGAGPPPANVNPEISFGSITPDYFATIGVPVRSGRSIDASDTAESPKVGVINDAAVQRWFPDRNPIGQTVTAAGTQRRIVGVVADIRSADPRRAPVPQLFVPYSQRTTRTIRLVVKSAGDPMAQLPAIRAAIRAIDPGLAVTAAAPLAQLVNDSVSRPRFYTSLLALFAGIALLLAATGIFGVMSYAVAQRSKEISVRMALGARLADVLGMIVGRAVALAGAGIVIGIAASVLLGRAIQSQLFGVGVFDPLTIAIVSVVLLVSASVASLLPARRAASLDPADALK
jgi:predicted permease